MRAVPVPLSAPLRQSAFRRFWFAALVSNTGSWMQNVAMPIAVHEATKGATWIGVVAIAGLVPALVANTFAGTLADRFERRALLLACQAALAMLALGLWLAFGAARPSMLVVCVLVAASSFFNGLSMTAWQAFVPSLVDRALLPSAVRLNSMQFAFGRAAGPFLAALLVARRGPRIGFAVNAASFIAVIAALAVLPRRAPATGRGERARAQLVAGWRYTMDHRSLALPALTNVFTGLFGFAVVQQAAPIASELFGRTRSSTGWLVGAFGVGGMVGIACAQQMSEHVRPSVSTRWSLFGWAACIAALGLARSFPLAVLIMVPFGVFHVSVSAVLNTCMQLQVDEAFRGRVVAVYLFGISAGVPLGSLLLGVSIDRFGARTALALSAAGLGAYAVATRALGFEHMDAPRPAGPPLWPRRARLAASAAGPEPASVIDTLHPSAGG